MTDNQIHKMLYRLMNV